MTTSTTGRWLPQNVLVLSFADQPDLWRGGTITLHIFDWNNKSTLTRKYQADGDEKDTVFWLVSQAARRYDFSKYNHVVSYGPKKLEKWLPKPNY